MGESAAKTLRHAGWLVSLAFALSMLAPTRAALAQQFQTLAPFAILIDSETRSVLFERAADDLMVPASMVKIMTAEVVFREIAEGRLKLDDEFAVSENAWRRGGAPSGGSSMFAALNSRINVSDLLSGLVVLSGNDAALVLAEGIAGSEGAFARRMDLRARELGFQKSTFANATGFGDPNQRTTARELALLADHIIRTYPELYRFFAGREFTWNKVRQQNRNPLLAMEIGADGLKTGNIAEAGFGLVGSAVQNGQRLIVVVNGLKDGRDRAQEARKLLDWGFRSFDSRVLLNEGTVVAEARVYGGERGSVGLVAGGAVRALVPRGSTERITGRVTYAGPLIAPVEAGVEVGRLKVLRGDRVAVEVPLYTAAAVPAGSVARRAFDAAWDFSAALIRRNLSRS